MNTRFIALTLFICTLWASVGIVIKLSLAYAPPLGLGAVRMLLSALVLWLWLSWRTPPKLNWMHWRIVAIGTLCYCLLQGFTHVGFNFTSAARGIVLLNTTPLFVAVLSHFIAPREPLNFVKGGGLLLAFAGVYMIFARGIDLGSYALGDALMLLAALSWGFHTLVTKRATKSINTGTLMLLQFLGSGVVLSVLSLSSEPISRWHVTPQLIAGIGYLAVVGTVVAWLLWVHVLKNVPAGAASSFIFSVPLIGIALSWLLLEEVVTLPFFIGAGLVSLAITIVNRRPVSAPKLGQAS